MGTDDAVFVAAPCRLTPPALLLPLAPRVGLLPKRAVLFGTEGKVLLGCGMGDVLLLLLLLPNVTVNTVFFPNGFEG